MRAAGRRHLTSAERYQWAELGHLLILQSIFDAFDLSQGQLAFHGGTSLHITWSSPRLSEDLDFLVEQRAASSVAGLMEKAVKRLRQALVLAQPDLRVEVREKAKKRLIHFQFYFSKPNVMEKVMVKVEFWRVSQDYLNGYQTSIRTPTIPAGLDVRARIDAMLPAASLLSALCDKLTAFATRPHLKWRDLFDYWWLRRQPSFVAPADDELCSRFLHHVSAYECTTLGDPAVSLRAFAEKLSEPAVLARAENDLKPFLPPKLWAMLWPLEVKSMLAEARQGALHLADLVETKSRRKPAAS